MIFRPWSVIQLTFERMTLRLYTHKSLTERKSIERYLSDDLRQERLIENRIKRKKV